MRLINQVFDSTFIKSLRPDASEVHRHLHRIFVDIDDWSIRQQERLERLLELADRHQELDLDTLRRLRSPDPVGFWGKFNQLVVADLVEEAGVEITFRPKGAAARVGEFEVQLAEPTFVEVKTMFPHILDQRHERQLMRLCRAASSIKLAAWIMIQVSTLPHTDPELRPFRAFLRREIPVVAQKPEGRRSTIYVDPVAGLRVRITYQLPLPEPPLEVSPFTGPQLLTEDDSVRASLKKAYRQLPAETPSLVILCSRLQFPPSPRLIRNAIYGTLQYTVRTNDLMSGSKTLPAEVTRRDDGFFARCKHSRLSSVGILDELHEKYNPQPALVFHHHPCPRYPVTAEALLPISRRQELAERLEVDSQKMLRLRAPFDIPWPKWDRDDDD